MHVPTHVWLQCWRVQFNHWYYYIIYNIIFLVNNTNKINNLSNSSNQRTCCRPLPASVGASFSTMVMKTCKKEQQGSVRNWFLLKVPLLTSNCVRNVLSACSLPLSQHLSAQHGMKYPRAFQLGGPTSPPAWLARFICWRPSWSKHALIVPTLKRSIACQHNTVQTHARECFRRRLG